MALSQSCSVCLIILCLTTIASRRLAIVRRVGWELNENLGESEGKAESGREGVSYIRKSVVLS